MEKIFEALEKIGSATIEEDNSVRDVYYEEYDILKQALTELILISLINASPESSVAISVRKLYQSVTGDKPNDPKLISFFHCA